MRFESDEAKPELDELKAIAKALKIDPATLLDEYYRFLDYPASVYLKEMRRRTCLTQKQLAERLDIHNSTVRSLENGRYTVTREMFEKMKKLGLLR